MTLCCDILFGTFQSLDAIFLQVLPAALALAKSPLLQGSALDELQTFFSALPACQPAGVTSDSLLASLLKAGQAKVHKPRPWAGSFAANWYQHVPHLLFSALMSPTMLAKTTCAILNNCESLSRPADREPAWALLLSYYAALTYW